MTREQRGQRTAAAGYRVPRSAPASCVSPAQRSSLSPSRPSQYDRISHPTIHYMLGTQLFMRSYTFTTAKIKLAKREGAQNEFLQLLCSFIALTILDVLTFSRIAI